MSQPIDKGYRLLGARFLRKHARRLAEQLEPVCLAEDVEAVHQARVASRRLRAALAMFADCFPSQSIKRWRKEIRRLTRGLGAARDQDVQILFLAEHLARSTDAAHTRGVAALLGRLERDRTRYQPKVVKVVQRLRRRRVVEEILDTTKAICSRAKAKGIDVRSPLAIERAETCLAERLSDLESHAAGLADPANVREHHAMRIASKGLRYTMEMLGPVFSEELDRPLAAARQLQTLLGEIHDYDVWDGRIELFEHKMRRRTANHFGAVGPFAPLETGLEHLREFCRRRRRELFDELCRFWAERPLAALDRSAGQIAPRPECPSPRCKNGRGVCRDTA